MPAAMDRLLPFRARARNGSAASVLAGNLGQAFADMVIHEDEDIYVLNVARLDGGWSNGYVSNAELTAIRSGAASVLAAAGATMERMAGVLSICPKNMTVFLRTSVSLRVS